MKLGDVKPGDLIQFRNYQYDRRVDTNNPDGSSSFSEDGQKRPHHTAIVEQVNGDGSLVVLEQNAPKGDPVARNTLFFKSGTTESGNTKTTVKVTRSRSLLPPSSALMRVPQPFHERCFHGGSSGSRFMRTTRRPYPTPRILAAWQARSYLEHQPTFAASERASEPRERSAPAKRRARERVGESEGRSPSGKSRNPT